LSSRDLRVKFALFVRQIRCSPETPATKRKEFARLTGRRLVNANSWFSLCFETQLRDPPQRNSTRLAPFLRNRENHANPQDATLPHYRRQNRCFERMHRGEQKAKDWMAERVGFEPTVEFPQHTLSKRAPSTTRTPLRVRLLQISRNVRPVVAADCKPSSLWPFGNGSRLWTPPKMDFLVDTQHDGE
jgi:hypothetical protein